MAANVGRIHCAECHAAGAVEADSRLGELIGGSRSQHLDRARGIVGPQCGERPERRQVAEPDRGVLGKATVEIVGDCLRPGGFAGERQGQGAGVRDVASLSRHRGHASHFALLRPCCRTTPPRRPSRFRRRRLARDRRPPTRARWHGAPTLSRSRGGPERASVSACEVGQPVFAVRLALGRVRPGVAFREHRLSERRYGKHPSTASG